MSSDIGDTPTINPQTIDRNLEAFRFGLTFSYTEITQLRNRDPIASFLVEGVTEEALGDGFTIYDKENEEINNWDEWKTHLKESNFLDKFIIFISDIRAYGSAGGLLFETGELLSFIPENVELFFNEKSRQIDKVICHEFFQFSNIKQLDHEIELKNDPEVDTFIYGIIKKGPKTFQGISVLEPVWDIINGLWIIDFMAALYASRVGAGIKIVHANTTDDNERDEILTSLRDIVYKQGIVLGLEDKFQLYTGEGSIDFPKIKDILYDSLASATGIPKTKWRGEVPGELSAGKINRSSYIEILKMLQNKSLYFLNLFINLISKLKKIALPEGFQIKYNYKEEPTEREKSEIDNIKANTNMLKANYKTGNEIRKDEELEPLEFFADSEEVPLAFLQKDDKFTIQLGDDLKDESPEQPIEPEQPDTEPTENEPDTAELEQPTESTDTEQPTVEQ